jgi:hypothetical protein
LFKARLETRRQRLDRNAALTAAAMPEDLIGLSFK